MAPRWYVIKTKPNLENFAADNLRNQHFKVFFPKYKEMIMQRKKQVLRIQPLYPSYIFVCFDINESKWKCINNTRGVAGILGMSGEDSASALPRGFVEDMLRRVDRNGFVELFESVVNLVKMSPGDKVRIKDNRYSGLVGICCESTEKRVSLFLTLLNREIRIELPVSAVQSLEAV